MNTRISIMRPTNETAERLMNKAAELKLKLQLRPGYFETATYCPGVRVADAAHAFQLGAQLGSSFGPVVFDAAVATVAFPDARVQA